MDDLEDEDEYEDFVPSGGDSAAGSNHDSKSMAMEEEDGASPAKQKKTIK